MLSFGRLLVLTVCVGLLTGAALGALTVPRQSVAAAASARPASTNTLGLGDDHTFSPGSDHGFGGGADHGAPAVSGRGGASGGGGGGGH